jgi:hypothetical protein
MRAIAGFHWVAVGVLVAGCALATVPAIGTAQGTCLPPSESTPVVLANLRRIAMATTGEDKVLKDALGISAKKATDVHLISDVQTCGNAAAAINARLGTPNQPRVMFLFKIGSGYGIDLVEEDEEFRLISFWNRRWEHLGTAAI